MASADGESAVFPEPSSGAPKGYVRDLRTLATAAEMLALRGVHPTVESAEAALARAQASPMPDLLRADLAYLRPAVEAETCRTA